MKHKPKKHLSAKGLLNIVKKAFHKIIDTKNGRTTSLIDCLMSAVALFGLKYPSLYQFDKDHKDGDGTLPHNLKTLYEIEGVPSDTYLRERLDEVDPQELRGAFKSIFASLQRSKELEAYQFYKGHYLISADGTGMFSSKTINCDNCCVKNHRNGTKTYYHQMICASMVHPDIKQVIPLAPEPIVKDDGQKKNDCERNASKRLIANIRREHPHLPIIFIEDALASNGPHIDTLKKANMRYILGVKPGDHKWLFDWVTSNDCTTHLIHQNGTTHEFKFINDAPLNESRQDVRVNFIEYKETNKKGKVQVFSWVTDFHLSKDNVYQIMRGGRARWKIENETFNTLKNQGYHFEHNFGHGNKNLCSVLGFMMLLAFLIDQVQELACPLFKAALRKRCTRKSLWERLRGAFIYFYITDWEDLYVCIAGKMKHPVLAPDTG